MKNRKRPKQKYTVELLESRPSLAEEVWAILSDRRHKLPVSLKILHNADNLSWTRCMPAKARKRTIPTLRVFAPRRVFLKIKDLMAKHYKGVIRLTRLKVACDLMMGNAVLL